MRITRLEIGCRNIEKQQGFYREVLGLKIYNETVNSFELHLGYSVLYFQQTDSFTPYHIAFHIPDKEEEKALEWLKWRVGVLKYENFEIVDFKGWDAKSLYFYDTDKNIMEFISRRKFNGESSSSFSEKSILGISEIGMATDELQEKYKILNTNTRLEVFDGNFEKFCAIGDDEGLLITINSKLKTWFPTGDIAYNSAFKIEFQNNEKEYALQYNGEKLKFQNPLKNNNSA
ncbi:catechol-2,3-dioxygenase [Gillisia sp. Hel_I_86]|uniref:VOC family protein n=1 Tax=Gillisia sp. Hel_I_86 TaxID=1249981 RepID=UPI0011999D1F|nr:VOC family protein [Gillisia sp. Hel_I_86]TVZ25370.1 catechol-2,3-dioxygenase [Gillisia sp. Hel_I_86]